MNSGTTARSKILVSGDRLESYGIYRLAGRAFNDFCDDSERLGKDYRRRELAKPQVRSLDSICANFEEGYGRGFGKELSQRLKIARGEARESRGLYELCSRLLAREIISQQTENLARIVGGLTKTIQTIEGLPNRKP